MFGVKDKGKTSLLTDTCIREFLVSDKATKNYRPSKSSNPVMARALQNYFLDFSSEDQRGLLYIFFVILEKSPINGSL